MAAGARRLMLMMLGLALAGASQLGVPVGPEGPEAAPGPLMRRQIDAAAAAAAARAAARMWRDPGPAGVHLASVEVSGAGQAVDRVQSAEDVGQRTGVQEISCKCQPFSKDWKASPQRAPASVYFDLGANKGDTFPPPQMLLEETKISWTCEHDFAYLFEANPAFKAALASKLETCPSHVNVFLPTAVANCDGSAKLYASANFDPHGWDDVGSTTRKDKTVDVNYRNSNDVAAVNLMRMLQENTLADDTVVIKMDIEGGEFDIIPCLADSPMAKHIDHLILERHDKMLKVDADTVTAFDAALAKLRAMGVHVNDKWQ